ncbi:TetR/AcrR family transcriptional regulator [Amycolatopsis sp. WAC 01375]|uniref:TetR/AcrR family transcriptional regulator n=1 Tax=unclassified Amycolatopsis TaxID=2618356 RepID=UPI000F7A7223|nr:MULTISPECIES: TetR/AcrR family transcriptional regulator [unclassified Amycolatopsis]RSM80204.1 TetR/AcrR family transcriptional regulator [Amycolatopsis sp. WAC 01375]RSN34310.1 TetR/AcrR family transcriptional regulator [Amycolatopsis sp. WAC 01416]
MPDEVGRRERKKLLTRQALVNAAVRLFAEQGYDQTSVADIAEAADVSKRTFFLHFPTKEDVLLADGGSRTDLAVRAIEGRRPGAPMREVLTEATKNMIAHTAAGDLPNGLAALRARLVVTTPAVQARVLHTMFTAQTRIAAALHKAYPDKLTEITAAGVVGALMGAISAAAVTSLQRGEPPERTRAAMQHAAEIALHHAGTLDSTGNAAPQASHGAKATRAHR